MILISALVFLQISGGYSQKLCTGFDFDRHLDHRLECGIFKTLVANQIQCHQKCVATLHCFSVNVYRLKNGTEVCELLKKSKTSKKESACFVKKYGTEHNELVSVRDCQSSDSKDCKLKQKRKALPQDWYQLGSTAYKLFLGPLNWQKASDACKSNGAELAQIENERENRFITHALLPDIRRSAGTPLPDSIKPLAYWKLDGTDKDVEIFGDSKFLKDVDGVTTVLHLPGTTKSYGETPAFDIRKLSFTMAVWVNMNQGATFLYSRWGSTVQNFAYGFSDKKYILQFNDELGKKNFEVFVPAYYKRWTHYTAVWDRTNNTASLYINGKKVYEKADSSDAVAGHSLPPLAPRFDIGYYRGEDYRMNGSLSQLYLFDRALTAEEVVKVRDSFYMGNSAWIGLNDIDTEGQYKTPDSQVASYLNFAPGQIAPDVQDCVSVRARDGRMDMNHCQYTALPYICMKQV